MLNRREFIRVAAVAGAGVVLNPGVPDGAWAAKPAPKGGPKVVMAKGGPVGRLTREAVDALGGMSAFVKKGETVIVKPNIGWDRRPEFAANTHPELVAEVVRMCLEAGAAKVKVFDRPCNDPRRCYTNSGIAPELEKIADKRLEVSYIDERRFRDVEIPGGVTIPRWSFYEDVLDADKFINLPIAKHHNAAVLTLGLKNVMGVIGKNRAVLHKKIHEYLPDLNRVVKSHLTIVDATRVLVANGPQGGSLADVKVLDTVVAGADVVSVDSVSCTLFGLGPADVRYVQLAQDAGLGVADLSRIDVKKISV
ncbi:MAG: DUF362 domain-containing protein [Nitrospirae bacterium]|nr:DUF362 domain-containing protein [Nitrospirota bacterium]